MPGRNTDIELRIPQFLVTGIFASVILVLMLDITAEFCDPVLQTAKKDFPFFILYLYLSPILL